MDLMACRLCGARIPEDQLTREKEFEHLICQHFELVMSLAESIWELEAKPVRRGEAIRVPVRENAK
jgi:hypothetical protein